MTIAIVNQKGGTGKTTTTVNLGRALVESGKKVLLVDMDTQGSLSYSLGIAGREKTIADVFTEDATLEEILENKEGMDVAASDVSLADIELSLAEIDGREKVLSNILDPLHDYDFVLIDCPPSLSLLTINALCAAKKLIIPMQMEVLSLQGLDLITETIGRIKKALNPDLEVLGILPVMVDSRRKLSSEIYDHIKENYSLLIFESRIRPNVRASEAPSFGQSVLTYAPESNSAVDYRAFANEFLTVI